VKTRSFNIVTTIMLSFLTHNDSYDTILTAKDGSLKFDGSDIIFVNNSGIEQVSHTTNNAIELWLKQGKIQEVFAKEKLDENDLVYRLVKRAEIRRKITTRKSVQEGNPDRIADLLEEAANEISILREQLHDVDTK